MNHQNTNNRNKNHRETRDSQNDATENEDKGDSQRNGQQRDTAKRSDGGSIIGRVGDGLYSALTTLIQPVIRFSKKLFDSDVVKETVTVELMKRKEVTAKGWKEIPSLRLFFIDLQEMWISLILNHWQFC